jgi:AcrR family transcriptional regulator
MNIHSVMAPRTQEDDKAERILDAALDLFVERGFHGTAVPELAERAKVGAGTIYRYFDDKEALVNALYRKWKTVIGQKMLDGFPFDKPAREQVRQVWMRMAEFALSHRREFAFLELHHHQSYLDDAARQIEQQMYEFAITLITQAQKRGEIVDIDPQILIALVNGAFIGLFRAMQENRVPFSKRSFEAAEEALWKVISP